MSDDQKRDSDVSSGVRPEDFDLNFAALPKLSKGLRLFTEAYGEDALPDDVDAFDFTGLKELRRMARELQVGPGTTFVDLACGMGGPGLWIARETGSNVFGIDFSAQAIKMARERAERWGMTSQAEYRLADMAATGLAEGVFAGAVSIDAIQFARDKEAVLKEVWRFLRLGARFVFTTWVDRLPEEGKSLTQGRVYDYVPLLEHAGFTIEIYEESEGWEERQRGVYQATLKYCAEIKREIGEVAGGALIEEAMYFLDIDDGKDRISQLLRIFIVVRK